MNENSFDDCYEDLQVSSNADQETIERVYRMLAKRYHFIASLLFSRLFPAAPPDLS